MTELFSWNKTKGNKFCTSEIGPDMSTSAFSELRRSTRVRLEVLITIEEEDLTISGVTVVVNLHGALIRSSHPFTMGTQSLITAYLTGKSARARVVYLPPGNPFVCGVEFETPQNIWGIALVPDDWYERTR